MVIETENLSIIIDVVDSFSEELDELAADLGAVSIQAEEVEEINIDVDVHGDEQAVADLSGVAAAAEAVDDASVDVSGGGGDVADDALETGGGRSRTSVLGRLSDFSRELKELGDVMGKRFDPDEFIDERAFADALASEDMSVSEFFERRSLGRIDFGDVVSAEDIIDTEALEMELDRDTGIFARFRRTVRSFAPLEAIIERANIRMSDLHNMVAKVVPLLAVFAASLPAAITGVVTLGAAALSAAGALAAIGGLGFLALAARGQGSIAQGFQDILKELKQSFLNAFMPLARRFDDLAVDALDGLKQLFNAMAARGDVLTQLKDDARAFGQFVLDTLPPTLATLTRLAEAFTPIFASFGQWLKGTDIIAAFVSVTRRAWPALMRLIDAFLGMLPVLIDMSLVFLEITSHVFAFWEGVWTLIDALGPLAEIIAGVLGLFAVGITMTAVWMLAFEGLGVAIWSSVIPGIARLIGALASYVVSMSAAATATSILTAALRGLLAVTGVGAILVGLSFVAQAFMDTSSAIDEATRSLENFKSVKNSIGDTSIGVGYGGALGRGTVTVVDQSETNVDARGSDGETTTKAVERANWKNSTLSPNGG